MKKKLVSLILIAVLAFCLLPLTAAAADTPITTVALTNWVRPVIGKTPTFNKINMTEFESSNSSPKLSNQTNGVVWTNEKSGVNLSVSNPFKADTTYSVTYYLQAKSGYVFKTSGLKATINGINATVATEVSAGSGLASRITVKLTGLVAGEIGSLDLTVTAPTDGAKPTYDKIDNTYCYSDNGLNGTSTKIYKNGIAWYKSSTSYISPGTTETFKENTTYTLKVNLLPKSGYQFTSKSAVKINGKSASVDTFSDGSITASVALTAPAKAHVHTASAWKSDSTQHWKECTECGAIVEAKKAHSDANADKKCDVCGYAMPAKSTNETTTSNNSKPADDTKKAEDPKKTDDPEKPAEATVTEDTDSTEDTVTNDSQPEESTAEAVETIGATEENKDEKEDTDKGTSWQLIVIAIVAVLFLVSAAVVVTVLVMKKKKN